jgi:transposase
MIAAPAGVKVLVATKPVDFRRGADSLAAVVCEQLQCDPFSGTIFIFRSRRADRLKILAWDGSGLVLFWNYLASYCISFNLKRGLWCSPFWLPRRDR